MDALQKYWHPNNPYPIIIADKKPWPMKDFHEIRRKWPDMHILFVDITKEWNIAPVNSSLENVRVRLRVMANILILTLTRTLILTLIIGR
jgi:hypothetical protein